MGSVHRAQWKSPGGAVPVAVKFLAGSRKTGAGAAFLREARAAARLSHPNVVTLLDAGRVADPNAPNEAGIPYLVMDWVDGSTLKERPPETWEETAHIVRGLLDALAHAHGWEVLHRDLKPANVMRGPDDVVRLMDFGIGRVLDEHNDAHDKRQIVGTPRYMAPEQVLGQWRDEGPWTDIYGLAAMVWELVTGGPLFEGETEELLVAHARQRPPSLTAQFRVPYGLRNWLYTALEKRPRDRFASAAEARAAFEDLEDAARTSRYPVVKPGHMNPLMSTRLIVPQRCESDDRPVRSELRAAGAGLFGMREPPIVGRATEKEMLWNAFRRVSRLDRSEVAVIAGASGTGKTALAAWLARRAREGGFAQVLRTTHQDLAAGEAGLSNALKRWLGIEGLAAGKALDRVAFHTKELGFEHPQDVALDFVTRCFPSTSSRRRLMDEEDWHSFLLEFARRIGDSAPTLWLIDDVHLSEASARFVEAAGESEFGLLVVCTTHDASVVEVRRSFTIELDFLSTGAMREFVDAMLPLEPSLVERLVKRAEGSPMFARQLLGDWTSRGVLHPGPLGYKASDDAIAALPDDVHAVWTARVNTALEGHATGALEALRIAAVLGREVRLDEWRQACLLLNLAEPEPLLEALAPFGLFEVERHQLVLSHALLRESILRDIDEPARYQLAAGTAVATLATSPRDSERSARHLWAAGEHVRALDALYQAITQYEDAEDTDAVLFCVPLLEDWAQQCGKDDNIYLADALVRLSRTLRYLAGEHSAGPPLERAAKIAFAAASPEELVAKPRPFYNRVAASVLIGQANEAHAEDPACAHDLFALARKVAQPVKDGQRAMIMAATLQADCLVELGRLDEAYQVLEQCLAGVEPATLPPRVAIQAEERLADMFELRDDFSAAMECLERAHAAATEVGDSGEIAFTSSRRGDMHAYAGEYDEARNWLSRAHEIYAERGSWAQHITALGLVIVDAFDGRVAGCLDRSNHFLKLFEEEPYVRFLSLVQMLAAAAEAANGNEERATELLSETIAHADVRVVRESVMLAVVLAEEASGELRARACGFAREHEQRLTPIFAARLNAITNGGSL